MNQQIENPLDYILSEDLRMSEENQRRTAQLRKQIKNSDCTACPQHQYRPEGQPPIPGSGFGRIMYVGHRVGKNETRSKEPAIGQASRYGFKMLLDTFPVDGDQYTGTQARDFMLDYGFVTNASRCANTDQKESVGASAWRKCMPQWLQLEINIVDPEVIVFWRKGVAKSLLGDNNVPNRGELSEEWVFGEKRPVLLMTHPVSLHYDGSTENAISREKTIKAQHQPVVQYLHDQGLMTEKPPQKQSGGTTNHILVDTPEKLEEMKEDLWDNRWIGFDSETGFFANPAKMTDQEKEKGALMWYTENQKTVCFQLAAADPQTDSVDRTYTIAVRFKDDLTGASQQDITPEQAVATLDELFRHAPEPNGEPVKREVAMHKATFDVPVATKDGLDLWGLTHQDYEIRIHDTLIISGRLNEHMGREEGMTTLDNLVKILLGESKGSFDDQFIPQMFPYEDLSDQETREELLEYTGEDARKVILVLLKLFDRLEGHHRQVMDIAVDYSSSLPEIGFDPYPKPNVQHTSFQLRDVALPIDQQMVPLINQMEMTGFKVDENEIESVMKFMDRLKRDLESKIHKDFEWFNPQSGPDAQKVMGKMARRAADLINEIPEKIDLSRGEVLECFQTKEKRVGDQVLQDDIEMAYKRGFGAIDAQRDTIMDKWLVYFESSLRLLRSRLEEIGKSLDSFKLPKELQIERMKMFFKRVFTYKQVHKKKSTYFERFAGITDRHNILHPESHASSTLSGRFSGNVQNVPRGGPEDREFIEEKIIPCLDKEFESEEKREDFIDRYSKIDVRQVCRVPQADDLNRMFEIMNLYGPKGNPWRVKEESYCLVGADYASQEDRMAYALSGDETKEFLLSEGWDTHWTNVAYCFGPDHGFDVRNSDGSVDWEEMEKAYEHFEGQPEKYKSTLRTPMKNVHYASTYGAGADKIHTLIAPIFEQQGEEWTLEDTRDLKELYDDFYSGVTESREELLKQIETRPHLEYPVYGAFRHAKMDTDGDIIQSEYLSAANSYNQGTCAYVTKTGMIRMQHLIEANADRWNLVHVGGNRYVGMLLQVHDEIAVICPTALAREVSLALESAMKFALEPGNGRAYWDNDQYEDYRGEKGWLTIPDPKLEGGTLFDADAEVKRTMAKAKVLSDGTKNVLAKLEDPKSFDDLEEKHPPTDINREEDLLLANKSYCEGKYLF